MSAGVSAVKAAEESLQTEAGPEVGWRGGTLSGLACKCLDHEFTDFLVKHDRIVCASCGREIRCSPPILGVFSATCGCCISTDVKTTFVLDSKGVYTCTWCGRTR
jgi:hypothetical protein